MDTLEKHVKNLETENSSLSVKLAVMESEKGTLSHRQRELIDRISMLEQQLQETHRTMVELNLHSPTGGPSNATSVNVVGGGVGATSGTGVSTGAGAGAGVGGGRGRGGGGGGGFPSGLSGLGLGGGRESAGTSATTIEQAFRAGGYFGLAGLGGGGGGGGRTGGGSEGGSGMKKP
jgi:chaperonin cofactor prefoldin